MAHTVAVTKLLDGPRHAIFHVYLKCDGLTGELADQIIIDPANLSPSQKPNSRFRLDKIWWDLNGFGVRFEFNNIPDTPIWTCAPNCGPYIDFTEALGGLPDKSGLDGSAALQISTYGFDNAIKQGSLIIKIKK